ncbi:hypothetical protein DDZ14_14760 [Maritimibacter sp. 55A14]|uniref:CheR family methyltransferase n=1 Tax=Maritimibacter sp. 55A14 TaxID=2174844 RepID=UPI000D603985|nr:CheR family methyltransferase [Maritimibacter sp. 55A14]PWE30553.1 hypothetical protein DDZ14_14760 [Maritimibacter sp. 55A14]
MKMPPAGLARVCQAARDLIAFRRLNLDADWPFHGRFDAIMCRNVAIYFDEQTQTRLWRRFADRLQTAGVLYIGHSEALPKELVTRFDQDAAGAFRVVDGRSEPARRSGISTEKTDESEGQNSHSCG